MNIVTIMNYDWTNKNNILLCKTWIKQAKIWLKKYDTVYILSRKKIPSELLTDTRNSHTCSFKNMICDDFRSNFPIHFGVTCLKIFSNHNFTFKLYNTTQINFPYLFLDADAYIVNDISELDGLFQLYNNKIFFIDHETNIPNETDKMPPFINSGVFLINDPYHTIYEWNNILNFTKKTNMIYKFKNTDLNIPGSDQAIIKKYLEYIGYDYTNNFFGIEYNTHCSMINEWFKNSDDRWQTTLKNDPHKLCKIVHYWGKNKPWNTNCPLIEDKECLND